MAPIYSLRALMTPSMGHELALKVQLEPDASEHLLLGILWWHLLITLT